MKQDLEYSTKVNTNLVQIISLSLPIALAVFIPQLNFATNTYFLGQGGESLLAANAVAGIFYMILTMVCYGFNNGLQVILSRRAGEENKLLMGKVFSNSLKLGMLFCFGMMLLSWLIAPIIFDNFIHNTEVHELAKTFIAYRVWGLPFFFLQQASIQFFISTKNSKYILVGTIISTLINILLDYWLILGNGGFQAMGMKGAAIASIVAEIAFVLINFGIIHFKKLHADFSIQYFTKMDKHLSLETIKISLPLVIQYFFSIASWQIFFIFVEHLGKSELAISQILRSVFGVVGCTSWALASTCNSMVSNLIGQGKQSEVIPLIKKISLLSFAASIVLSILLLVFPSQFLAMYSSNNQLIQQAIPALYVVIIATILLSISTIWFNAVLGIGNTTINLRVELVAISVYIIYIYTVIEKLRMPLAYAWGSEFIYWSSILVMSVAYLKFGKWRLNKSL
jgi:multidrug resistance protein, MATE family